MQTSRAVPQEIISDALLLKEHSIDSATRDLATHIATANQEANLSKQTLPKASSLSPKRRYFEG